MAKATTHPTCKPTNLNIRTRSSTLYANAPILLASILLNFRRRPESHLQLQVSEKLQELQNMRARSLSENPGQASARENLRRNPRFSSSCLLDFPVSDLFHSPTSVFSYQRIVILGQNIQYLQILTCSHIP